MKKYLKYKPIQNSSGFIVADFLFAFVMVLGIGIFIFGITFSLATIEVAQYIVWSTARNYSAGNASEGIARGNAQTKFQNLAAKFPLLTGLGAGGREWFELKDPKIGNLADSGTTDTQFLSEIKSEDLENQHRQPWTGARAIINLKLFSGLKIPFLGKVAEDRSLFEFPIRAFIIRHPSQDECREFFFDGDTRYNMGIKKLEDSTLANDHPMESSDIIPAGIDTQNGFGEDNGC